MGQEFNQSWLANLLQDLTLEPHRLHDIGSIIISLRPYSFALASRYLDSHCSSCTATSNSGLLRCTRCRTVRYCNTVSCTYTIQRFFTGLIPQYQTCQTNDWSLHRLECSALTKWAKSAPSKNLSVPSDAVRCLGRILWQKQKEGFDSSWVGKNLYFMDHTADST